MNVEQAIKQIEIIKKRQLHSIGKLKHNFNPSLQKWLDQKDEEHFAQSFGTDKEVLSNEDYIELHMR